MITCDICNKKIKSDHYDTDGEHDFHSTCWETYLYESAIAAGIPRSVVEGKTGLKDHFSQEYIDFKCNKGLKDEIS